MKKLSDIADFDLYTRKGRQDYVSTQPVGFHVYVSTSIEEWDLIVTMAVNDGIIPFGDLFRRPTPCCPYLDLGGIIFVGADKSEEMYLLESLGLWWGGTKNHITT